MKTEELKMMVKKYGIELITMGPNSGKIMCPSYIPVDGKIKIAENKEELISYLTEVREAEKKAAVERNNKISSIEGLDEISNAISDWNEYYEKYNEMMDDEQNDGVNMPNIPTSRIEVLKEKYPRAAAYLKAKTYANSENYRKNDIGRKALERIINDEDFNVVISDMEQEWKKYLDERAFD